MKLRVSMLLSCPALCGLLLSAGCRTTLPSDSVQPAVLSGDASLVMGACSQRPVRGVDVCYVHDGDAVTSAWRLYLPWGEQAVTGDLRIKRGDRVYNYKIASDIVDINWTDIVGATWTKDDVGLVQALATIKYEDRVVQALGYSFIVVLNPGYDPQPTGSESAITKQNCTIEYTDKGRSRVLCTRP
jgi:hypothetical protein